MAQGFGGPPWTLVGMAALVLLALAGPRLESLALATPSLLWLGVAQATGSREFFFPYSMHLAAVSVCRLDERGPAWGIAAGGAVAAVFLAIRTAQQATLPVLAVEWGVATVILVAAALACARLPRRTGVAAAIIAASALLACAGLAL